MADRFNKSDTMDLTNIIEEAQLRRNIPEVEDDYVFTNAETPEETAASSRHGSGNRSQKPLIITLAVIGVVLVAGVIIFALSRSQKDAASDTAEPTQTVADVAENVVVSGINVGGMSYSEAKAALAPAEQKLADEIRFEINCGEKKIILTKDDFAYSFNTDELLAAAQNGSSDGYQIRMKIDESSIHTAAAKVASAVDREAQDAKVVAFNADQQDMFTYQEAVTGLKLNRDDLAAQLRSLAGTGAVSGTLEAKLTEEKPEYTVEYLKQNIKKLSSFTTESTNTANGMSNQKLALSSCNSSIIEPGATWSFNNCTGDSNLESRGYLPAGVIVQGRHEIGIGGGICQSSTTIYNAGILCGMEIVERYEHYYPSSYVDYGLDATIDYGNLDLKLRNPFEHQVFLKCWMDGVILHAEFYGLPQKDFDQIKVTVTAPTYTKTSFSVKASRTYYLNGKSVRTEALPSSTYYFSAPGETEAPTTAPTTAPTQPATAAPTTPSVTPTEPSGDPGTTPSENPGIDPSESSADDPPVDDPASEAPASGEAAP